MTIPITGPTTSPTTRQMPRLLHRLVRVAAAVPRALVDAISWLALFALLTWIYFLILLEASR